MRTVFHLGTCNTCQRILSEWKLPSDVKLQDIKTEALTPEQLDQMQQLAGSYEALFSKRAQLYRGRGLHEKTLSEADYRELILDHYTFLKRPVLVLDNQIFVGNSKKVVAAASEALS